MFFLKISNVDILFSEKSLIWKFYTTNKALLTIKQVQLINSKEFIIAALDADSKTLLYIWPSKSKKKWLQILIKRLRLTSRLRPKLRSYYLIKFPQLF